MGQVVDAVTQHRVQLDWARDTSWQQALRIIGAAHAGHYTTAAEWLARAKAAAVAAGPSQVAAWRSRVEEVLAEHKRTHKLVPLLQSLLQQP